MLRRDALLEHAPPSLLIVFAANHEDVDVSDLISTGEAAKILGCSRQHVVDLCNDGKLRVVRKGGPHRFVSRDEVPALTIRLGTREQEQSRWLHGAVAGHYIGELSEFHDTFGYFPQFVSDGGLHRTNMKASKTRRRTFAVRRSAPPVPARSRARVPRQKSCARCRSGAARRAPRGSA